MSDRTVLCKKFKKEMPGLAKAPFGGEMGKQIFDHISAEAWRLWKDDMQIKVLNEYHLNMSDKNDYQKLVDQMLLFLNLKDGEVVEVENAQRGGNEKK